MADWRNVKWDYRFLVFWMETESKRVLFLIFDKISLFFMQNIVLTLQEVTDERDVILLFPNIILRIYSFVVLKLLFCLIALQILLFLSNYRLKLTYLVSMVLIFLSFIWRCHTIILCLWLQIEKSFQISLEEI